MWVCENSVIKGKICQGQRPGGVVTKAYWEKKTDEDKDRKCSAFTGTLQRPLTTSFRNWRSYVGITLMS